MEGQNLRLLWVPWMFWSNLAMHYSHSCPGSDADQATTLPYEMATLPYEPAAPEAPLLQPPVDAAGEKPLPKVSWLKINPK